MSETMMTLLKTMATLPGVLFLFAVMILCVTGFKWRSRKLELDPASKVPDARFWYSLKDIWDFLEKISPKFEGNGIKVYAITQVTLDFIFPIAYGTFFAVLIAILYSEEVNQKLVAIPFLATMFDISENFLLAYLALNYAAGKHNHAGQSSLAKVASVFTFLKWSMAIGSVLLTFGGIIYRYSR